MGESISTEAGPHGIVNNSYFLHSNSGVVLGRKELSRRFLSWYRSCMYAHVKGPHLFFRGFVCLCVLVWGGVFFVFCFLFFLMLHLE